MLPRNNGRILAVGSRCGRPQRPRGRLRGLSRDSTAEMWRRGWIGQSDGWKFFYPSAVEFFLSQRNSGALGTPRPGQRTSGSDVQTSGAGSDVVFGNPNARPLRQGRMDLGIDLDQMLIDTLDRADRIYTDTLNNVGGVPEVHPLGSP